MKKGQIVTGIVKRVDFPNKGIVMIEENAAQNISGDDGAENAAQNISGDDGTFCTVKNVIPGQKVSLMVKKVRKGKAEGILKEVLSPAPNQINPSCPHFGECGGCTYLHLSYEDQAALKEKQVKRLLEGVLTKQEHSYEFMPIKHSPVNTGYRNKMEFTFGDAYKEGPLELGLHKRGSFYDILTVDDCQICDEDYRSILRATREYFLGLGLPHYHRMQHTGYLRHLLVRKAAKTGEILVSLVTTTQQKVDLSAYVKVLLDLPLAGKITGILHTENDSLADVVKSDTVHLLYGRDFIQEELLGLTFKISQFSFFQTNSLGAEVLYQTAREFIGDLGSGEKVVYDLYSGTGTIAQMIAPVAKKVIGVEIVEEAVEAARENAAVNGLSNCEFIAGDVLKVLDDVEEKPDFIILDPPRDGVHPKALRKILSYDLERMIYISCKPTSLVRDLEVFLENGYEVEKVCCVDQFPWTANIETVVLLSKLNAKHHVNMNEMDLTSAEVKTAYKA